jgi:hypothetical protein
MKGLQFWSAWRWRCRLGPASGPPARRSRAPVTSATGRTGEATGDFPAGVPRDNVPEAADRLRAIAAEHDHESHRRATATTSSRPWPIIWPS